MTKSLSKPSEKSGMRPGTLVHVGEVSESATRMTVVNYDKEVFEQAAFESIDEILKYKHSETITWVIIEGLTNIGVIERLEKNSTSTISSSKIF